MRSDSEYDDQASNSSLALMVHGKDSFSSSTFPGDDSFKPLSEDADSGTDDSVIDVDISDAELKDIIDDQSVISSIVLKRS